jgi:LDH2 family malate/lactate/ureidoglycolate dehydrogenase
MPWKEYYARMEQFLGEIKASPRSRDAEEILYPGERRHRTYLENARRGVALPTTVKQELEGLAREYDTEFPTTKAAR